MNEAEWIWLAVWCTFYVIVLKTSWSLRFNACLLHTSHTIAISNVSISIFSKHRGGSNENETLASHLVVLELLYCACLVWPHMTTQPTPFQVQAKWYGTSWCMSCYATICDVNIPICSTLHHQAVEVLIGSPIRSAVNAVSHARSLESLGLAADLSTKVTSAIPPFTSSLQRRRWSCRCFFSHLYSCADFCRGDRKW